MNNVFNILINDKTVTKLSGNDLGKEIFDQQLKDHIDYTKKIIIRFPDQIDYLGSSFIQGFFASIVDNIGLQGIEDSVEVEANIQNVKLDIINNLL